MVFGSEQRTRTFNALMRISPESSAQKALLLNPPQGEAGERSRFSAPASGGNVVNNMNGEKK